MECACNDLRPWSVAHGLTSLPTSADYPPWIRSGTIVTRRVLVKTSSLGRRLRDGQVVEGLDFALAMLQESLISACNAADFVNGNRAIDAFDFYPQTS